jgi:hypothetical protein
MYKNIQIDLSNCLKWNAFLGTFAKLREVPVSFSTPVHMEQLSSHWMDFHEIWYWNILQKPIEVQVSLKSDKNNRYFT